MHELCTPPRQQDIIVKPAAAAAARRVRFAVGLIVEWSIELYCEGINLLA